MRGELTDDTGRQWALRRKALGLSRGAMVPLTGLKYFIIADIETGNRAPKRSEALRIEPVLNAFEQCYKRVLRRHFDSYLAGDESGEE